MSGVTLKILHGADRGKVYENLAPPFTVGREEGNDIQLNDERISRCHFKVQRDNDRLVLTDLDSTNGTKVNGVECQLKILRHGDLIAAGRSLMLIGSESQIAARLAALGGDMPGGRLSAGKLSGASSPNLIPSSGGRSGENLAGEGPRDFSDMGSSEVAPSDLSSVPLSDSKIVAASLAAASMSDASSSVQTDLPPLPPDLSPGQKAQVAELIEHVQQHLHRLIESVEGGDEKGGIRLRYEDWQSMLAMQAKLATLSRHIADPPQ